MRWLQFGFVFVCQKAVAFWIPAPVFTGVTFFRGNDGAKYGYGICRLRFALGFGGHARMMGMKRTPRAARYMTTTERRTSPRSILWNASSTSSRAMVSDTKASKSSLPCR